MKTINYLVFALIFTMASCKKPGGNEETVPAKIHLEIIGKDGNNMVHSIKDSLVVTYIKNGVTEASRLTIYKVQVSATDTTSVTKYNGLVVTDWNPADNQGYISSPSAGGVRDFNLYLNGISVGIFHFDYWGYLSLPYPPPLSSTCTFDGVPVKGDVLTGSFSDGTHITENADSPGEFIYVLQMQ